MYKSLQACRALAACMVLLFHVGGAIAAAKYFGITAFEVPFAFGGAGVEFFFVLSGFIIYHAHRADLSRPARLGNYVHKRATRIYPTYLIVLGGVYALALATPSLRATVDYDALTMLKAALLVPMDKTVVGGTGAPVIGVAWTLQYEMMFYAFFALLILDRRLGIAVVLAFVAGYFAMLGDWPLAFPWAFVFRNYTWLFLMGVGVAMLCGRVVLPVRTALQCAGFGALIFAVVAGFNIADPELLESQKVLMYGIASSLVVFGLVQAENQGKALMAHPWLQLLGDASYALYLIHYPLVSILCKVAVAAGLKQFGVAGALAAFVFITLACLAAAVVFHLLIERPVARLLRRRKSALAPANA